jgi:hypothetical protein
MSQSALRAQRKKEQAAEKEAEKLLQRELELQAAKKLKERLMAASLGRTDALRMTPQQLKKLGITIVYTSSPKKTPHGARSASAVAEGGRRSRRMRRVRRHRMTHRRKHHATRRRHRRSGRSKRGGGFSSETLYKKYLEIENDPSATPEEKDAAYIKYEDSGYLEALNYKSHK